MAQNPETPHATLIDIEYPEDIKFQPPQPPTFKGPAPLWSIVSLLFMTLTATLMYGYLVSVPPAPGSEYATWTLLPFAFTIFGAGLGFLYELYLYLTGRPFQMGLTPWGRFVSQVRLLNLAPVTATIFFFVVSMVVVDPGLRTAFLYLSGFAGFGLALLLFFGGAERVVPGFLIGLQVLAVVLVAVTESPLPAGGALVSGFLVSQAILQTTSLVIGTVTPARSTAFHVISTFAGVFLLFALIIATNADPTFSTDVAIAMPEESLVYWGFIVSCLAGVIAANVFFPQSYSNWRAKASKLVWSGVYFLLVSADRFPKPENLSKVYDEYPAEPTGLKPYFQVHKHFLRQKLSIPASTRFDREITVSLADLLTKTKKIFSMIALLDHFFPQANVNIPLDNKPRMPVWSDGEEFWPSLFTKNISGHTIPVNNGRLEKAPAIAVEAFKEGQLLAYLTEYGVGATFAKPAKDRGDGILVSDFRHFEKYETKPDYEPYGGLAIFKINADEQKLELTAVVAPRTEEEIPVNPNDATFRRAESMVIASLYFAVISGKHLAEIHMTYNLVEVAMDNAFDAQKQWMHPFRTFMYLHFFSHEVAEELTTEHLVQEGAVFSQIFATTHNSLIDHLNDQYHSISYGEDENFEERAKAMSMGGSGKNMKLLPNACINWELRYAEIFQKYTTDLIDVIYKDDKAVQSDNYLQDFYRMLLEVIPNGLPERYDGFQTKKGVARFSSDTIYHAVIRHQVYGTTGVRAAMDPRINQVQVPKDQGPPAVDEWRSLAYVALATGRARFTLLMDDFTYLLDGVDENYKAGMAAAFNALQDDLKALDNEWNSTDSDKQWSYDYMRAVPSSLHTGPGY